MNKKDFRQSTIHFYADISSICKEGQSDFNLRCEFSDHPANQVDCSGAKVFIGRLENTRKFVAFIDIGKEDGEVAVIYDGKIRKIVEQDITFGMIYSHYAPSNWYRQLRELRGYDKSRPLQTKEQKKEQQDRSLMALAMLAKNYR